MRVGQARRRDENEPAIVAALQAIGVLVLRLSDASLPDLLTFYRGEWLPIEVKMPGGDLTHSQAQLWALTDFPIVQSEGEALKLFGVDG